MDLKQLVTLVALSQEQNYIKASEKLNYAPSTLAKHIHSLEDEFHLNLVKYTNSKIELTNEGKSFLEYAKKILTIYEEMQVAFDGVDKKLSISVAGGELMLSFSFGEFFDNYNKQHEVNVLINPVCCARVPEWLMNNEVDIGFVQTLDKSEIEGTITIPIFKERLCLMANANHELLDKKLSYKDLKNQNFAFTYEDCCFTAKFKENLKKHHIKLKNEYFLGSVHAVVNSVKNDNAICLIPYVARKEVEAYGLKKLDFEDEFEIYDVILMKKNGYHEIETKMMIDNAFEYAKSLKEDQNFKDIELI